MSIEQYFVRGGIYKYQGKLLKCLTPLILSDNKQYIQSYAYFVDVTNYQVTNYDRELITQYETLYERITDQNIIDKFNSDLNKEIKKKGFRNYNRLNVAQVGSDPEIFVVDENNEVLPAYEFLQGKDNPNITGTHKDFNITGNNCIDSTKQKMFWDGFQAEFNTCATGCLSWVVDSVAIGMASVLREAQKKNPKATLSIKTLVEIPPEILASAKPEHVEFGCMPSFNVYGMEGMKANGRDVNFRSTGGHIHLGLKYKDPDLIKEYVKALDKILGVACVALFAKLDDPRRRTMYGLAGEYRTPAHGLEYRTLSNAWMCHPLIMNLVFEIARATTAIVDRNAIDLWETTERETIDCINNCDVDLAREILARNKVLFKELLSNFGYYGSNDTRENIYKMFMLGVESLIKNPNDIMNNWSIGKDYTGHCDALGMTVRTIQYIPTYNKLKESNVAEIYEELVANINAIDVEEAIVQAV